MHGLSILLALLSLADAATERFAGKLTAVWEKKRIVRLATPSERC